MGYTNYGAVFLKKYQVGAEANHLDSARLYLQRAAAIQTQEADYFGLSATLNYLGEAWLSAGKGQKALPYLYRADSLGQEHSYLKEQVRSLSLLSRSYEQIGQMKFALKFQKAFKEANDELFNIERDREIGRKEAWLLYQQELKEDQLRFAGELEVELGKRKLRNLVIVVIGLSLVLLVIVLVWLYGRWKSAGQARELAEEEVGHLAETNKQIEEKNQELQARIREVQNKLEDRKEDLPAHLEKLTKREMEVLLSLGLGLTDKEIAERLFISTSTVRTHNRKIFEKLALKNRTEAGKMIHRYRLV